MKIVYSIMIKNKFYVGSTKNLKNRIAKHKQRVYKRDKCERKNYYKIYKYIRENNINFTDIIFFVEEEYDNDNISKLELRKREQHYIDYYNSIENGLNMTKAYITKEEEWKNIRIKCDICDQEMNQGSLTRHKERKH